MRKFMLTAAVAVLAGGAMLALSACGSTTVVGSGPAPDTVTAIGTGTGTSSPDTAQFSLGVTFTGKDRVGAQNGASKAAAAIISAVRATGIDAKDIQTSQISLSQLFDPTGRTVTGYQASQSIDVKTKLLDKVGAAVAAATGAGATNVSGPQFSLSDTNAARIDAIGKAMADARARAAAIAKAAGRTLGRVVSATEAAANPVAPLANFSASASAAGAAPPVEPGQIDTSAQLTVVFALQ
jgi:uncharacterized protein YggE